MTRPEHPVWCARSRCTAALGGIGEHRSAPVTLDAPVSAVVTMTKPTGRPTFVEVRLSVPVPAATTDERAGATAALSAVALLVDSLIKELQP